MNEERTGVRLRIAIDVLEKETEGNLIGSIKGILNDGSDVIIEGKVIFKFNVV